MLILKTQTFKYNQVVYTIKGLSYVIGMSFLAKRKRKQKYFLIGLNLIWLNN